MFPAAGKHGRKRNFRLREPTANEWIDNGDDSTPFLWSNNARRCLVAAAAGRLSRIVDLYCLFDLGGVSGRSLFFRQLHLPLLFAGAFRRFAAQLVWGKTKLVAGLVNLFAGVANSLGAGRISADLLLLSRRVLQSILGGSARVHGGRAAQDISGRTLVPADHAKRAPLFLVSRSHFYFHFE